MFGWMMIGVLSVVLSGCSTLSETPKERQSRLDRVQDQESKAAVEDWDRFWLNDHASRLSPNNM